MVYSNKDFIYNTQKSHWGVLKGQPSLKGTFLKTNTNSLYIQDLVLFIIKYIWYLLLCEWVDGTDFTLQISLCLTWNENKGIQNCKYLIGLWDIFNTQLIKPIQIQPAFEKTMVA